MMAKRLSKSFNLKTAGKVSFSSQVAPKSQTSSFDPDKIEISVLPNGLKVVSNESYSPISHIGVMLSASSKYETPANYGTSHMLRLASALTNPTYTQFGITRNLQQKGISLTTTSSRDYLAYQISGIRDNCHDAIRFLVALSTNAHYKPWEIKDHVPVLKRDIASIKLLPEVRAYEMLHEAAFHKSGLGISIFSPDCMIGKHTSTMLNEFAASHCKAGSTVIYGIGIDHDDLLKNAERVSLAPGKVEPIDCPYYGGEIRKFTGGKSATVMIAVKGTSLKDLKHSLALSILEQILGTGANAPWGHAVGRLGKAGHKAVNTDFSVSAFNARYRASGLLGFVVTGSPVSMAQLIPALHGEFMKTIAGGLSVDEVTRGKAKAKCKLLSLMDRPSMLGEFLGEHLLCHDEVKINQLLALLDEITEKDIMNALGKDRVLSMSCIGNISTVPYICDLK